MPHNNAACARVAKLSPFLAPVRLSHSLKKCACSIDIWQLRARVDWFQRYSDQHFVSSGKTLAGTFVKGSIHVTKLSSLIRMNCKHLRFTSLLFHGSVDRTILRPSVVAHWLPLPFLAFFLAVTRPPCSGETSFLSYFFVPLHTKVTWQCFCEYSCMQFTFSLTLLSCICVCVCHSAITT